MWDSCLVTSSTTGDPARDVIGRLFSLGYQLALGASLSLRAKGDESSFSLSVLALVNGRLLLVTLEAGVVGGGGGVGHGGGGADRVLVVLDLVVVVHVVLVVVAERVEVVVVGRGVRDLAMPAQRLRVDEGLGAERAGVGSLAGVAQAVPLEAGRVLVRLAAVVAVVRPEMGSGQSANST